MAIYRDGSIDENWATIPNALFRSGFPLRVVAVLGNLLTHRPDFPVTVKLMAEQLGVTPKTVTQAINDLEELGLVERVPVPGEPGKFGRNDYRLREQRLVTWQPEVKTTDGKGEPEVKITHGPEVKNTYGPEVKNTYIEDQDKTLGRTPTSPQAPQGGQGELAVPVPSLADDFADWYAAYPRKVGKKDAEKAYKRARKGGATREELLAGVERSVRSWRVEGRSKDKLPYPATWLNQGRWEDEETLGADVGQRGDYQPTANDVAQQMIRRMQEQRRGDEWKEIER